MTNIALNPAQTEILEMLSFVKEPQMLEQLKQSISDFFAHEVQKEIDRLWEEDALNEEVVEGFRNLHERTPYK